MNAGWYRVGEPQPRFSVKFYLIAMLFILFDLEIVFMYPWAVVYRDMIHGHPVIFWSMLSFVSILMLGYIYALRKGVARLEEADGGRRRTLAIRPWLFCR